LESIYRKGVSWSEFNEIIGLNIWRKRELEFLPNDQIEQAYGTKDLIKIVKMEEDEIKNK
jgi:hypothetical protein